MNKTYKNRFMHRWSSRIWAVREQIAGKRDGKTENVAGIPACKKAKEGTINPRRDKKHVKQLYIAPQTTKLSQNKPRGVNNL
ncbi:MAG TPA: hypothetical protein P5075_02260 [Eubacteriales bacterium]|nr:hypothetical protein [Eubacteriales bacterium]